MEKLEMPNCTLICVDCVNTDFKHREGLSSLEQSIKVMERCKSLCNFGAVKLLTSIPSEYQHRIEIQHIPTLVDYSLFVLKRIHEYVQTTHMLIVQGDGWILNPFSWEESWNNLDYIGPLFNQYDIMGVGGFSYRSTELMKAVSKKYPHWDGTPESTRKVQSAVGLYEDGAIAITSKASLISEGFKFATLEQASRFAQGGNPNPKYYVPNPFGFHGSWRSIDQSTGTMGSSIKHDGYIPQPI